MTADPGRDDGDDMPSQTELDATDRVLSSIAVGTRPSDGAEHDGVTQLLLAASGPAGAGELVGSDRFVDAVSSAPTRPHRASAPVAFVGKAVAAKAAVIAAVTVLGIAGAGAATGVILHVANDTRPQPVVTVDDPDATSTGRDGNGELDLGDPTFDGTGPGPSIDPARVRTCASATDGPGLAQLAQAATEANTTATDYCRGTGTAADPDRPDAATPPDATSSDDRATARDRGADAGAPPATPGPPAGGGGPANGGGSSNGSNNAGSNNKGGATPGTPNSNANGNATPGTPNPNAAGNNHGGATPGTPNPNANGNAAGNGGHGNGGSGSGTSNGGAAAGGQKANAGNGSPSSVGNGAGSAGGSAADARVLGGATSGGGGDTAPGAARGASSATRPPTAPGAAAAPGSPDRPERQR
jgi:hypothetical protein